MEEPILPPVESSRKSIRYPVSTPAVVHDHSRRSRILTCRLCKFTTVDSKKFLSHQISAHTDHEEEPPSCDRCNFVASSSTDLITHKHSHLQKAPTLTGDNTMEGNHGLMDEANNNDTSLVKASVTKPGPLSSKGHHELDVNIPHNSYSDQNPVKDGCTKAPDGIVIFECDFCTFATTQLSDYETHKQVHSEENHQGISEGRGLEDSFCSTQNKVPKQKLIDGDREFEIKQMQRSYEAEANVPLFGRTNDYGSHETEDDDNRLVIDEGLPKPFMMNRPVVSRPLHTTSSSLGLPRAKPGPKPNSGVSKPRGCAPVREAVDPAKYITIQEADGIKYACSKCGNIYKWRKSLNKHWKEKHDGEIPDPRPNLTALNIPRLGKGYVTGLANGKGNVISFVGHTEGSPKTNAVFMAGGEMSKTSAIRSALKRPAMSEAFCADQKINRQSSMSEPVRKNGGMVKFPSAGALPSGGRQPKMARMSDEGMFPKYMSSPTSSGVKLHNYKKSMGASLFPPPQVKSVARNTGESPMDLTKAHPGLPWHRQNQHTSELGDVILDLSRKSCTKVAPKMMPVNNVGDGPLQDEPIDLSVKTKCEVIVSSIQRETERVEGFSYISEEIASISLQCPSCAYSASSKQDYDKHMELHLRQQQYKCAECQQVYSAMEELNDHFINYHTDVVEEKLMGLPSIGTQDPKSGGLPEATQLYKYLTMDSRQHLSCMVCGMIFQWQWTLAKHFEDDHHMLPNPYKKKSTSSSYGPTKAPMSPQLSDDDDTLNELIIKEKIDRLQCPQCAFVAGTSSELTRHQLKHSIGRHYICRVCSYMTKWKDHLLSHYKQEHPTACVDASQIISHNLAGSTSPKSDNGLLAGGKMIDLTDEDTAIVFPQAPEDENMDVSMSDKNLGIKTSESPNSSSSTEMILPFKCTVCEYRARWPSEITQHMKNHSDEKPYLCPRCSYRSKWKWDVVKHLKRCGGGTVNDVIDTTKQRKAHNVQAILSDAMSTAKLGSHGMPLSHQRELLSNGPPNVTVMPSGQKEPSLSLDVSNHDESFNSSFMSEPATSPCREKPVIDHNDGNGTPDPNNQAYHVCLHCPFVGNSPAELKRHSRVHSDEKPFICKTCGYCSKWKCDLKKHLRTYNHTSAVPLTYGGHGRKPADWKENKVETNSDGDSNDGDGDGDGPDMDTDYTIQKNEPPKLYKCEKCQYVTYKKNFMDSHMKIHRSSSLQIQTGWRKCKKCDFEAPDLPTFLQHKLTHSNQQTEDPLPEMMLDTMQPSEALTPTKHRRKALRQNRIISNKSEPEEEFDDDTQCMDLSNNNPVTLRDCKLQMNDCESKHGKVSMVRTSAYKCLHCPYKTDNKNNYEKHVKFHNLHNKYVCEWCNWSIDRLNLLYRHAQTVHPEELALQEKETFYGKVRRRGSSEAQSQDSVDEMEIKNDMEDNNDCNSSRARRMSWSKRQDMSNIEKRRLEARREGCGIDEELPPELRSKRRRRLKTCSKCGYITDNVTTLQRHMAKHGSKGKFTCDYCDYSVDRQHIVEYHIKIVHHQTSDMSGLVPQSEENSEYDEIDTEPLTEDLEEDISGAEEDHYEEESSLTTVSEDRAYEDDEDESAEQNYNKTMIWEVTKIKGITMKVQRIGRKTTYHCLKCPFFTCNITNAVNHMKQHGARKKYTCELCDYSLDQLRHVMQHMKKVHGHGGDTSFSDNGEDLSLGEHVDDSINDSVYNENTEDYVSQTEHSLRIETEKLPGSAQHRSSKKSKAGKQAGPLTNKSHQHTRYHCMKCPFVTQGQQSIRRHEAMHKRFGAKSHCLDCDYKATTAKLLESHFKMHHN